MKLERGCSVRGSVEVSGEQKSVKRKTQVIATSILLRAAHAQVFSHIGVQIENTARGHVHTSGM